MALFLAAVDFGYIGSHRFSRLVFDGVWMTIQLTLLGTFPAEFFGAANTERARSFLRRVSS